MIPMLIADDNAAIVDILKTFATPAGFAVTAARDGEEALRLFHEGHFEVVLLDVMMPKIDGFAVGILKVEAHLELLGVIATTDNQRDCKDCEDCFFHNSFISNTLFYNSSLPKSLQPDCILPLWQSSMNFRKVLKA